MEKDASDEENTNNGELSEGGLECEGDVQQYMALEPIVIKTDSPHTTTTTTTDLPHKTAITTTYSPDTSDTEGRKSRSTDGGGAVNITQPDFNHMDTMDTMGLQLEDVDSQEDSYYTSAIADDTIPNFPNPATPDILTPDVTTQDFAFVPLTFSTPESQPRDHTQSLVTEVHPDSLETGDSGKRGDYGRLLEEGEGEEVMSESSEMCSTPGSDGTFILSQRLDGSGCRGFRTCSEGDQAVSANFFFWIL